MFADFSKILTQNFIVSYLTPSVLFILISSIILLPLIPEMGSKSVDNISSPNTVINNPTKETFLPDKLRILWEDELGMFTFLSFVLSIILLLFNRPMIRMLEGYYLLPISGATYLENKKFYRLRTDLESTQEDLKRLKSAGEDLEAKKNYVKVEKKYCELGTKLRTEFPFDHKFLLPTSFGNTIRSFELYSYRVYGIDAICCWSRIINFASESHRNSVNDASSRVDFAVNSIYLTSVIIIELLALSFMKVLYLKYTIISTLLFVVLLICLWKYAIMSAKSWGNEVKSVFDLYRYDLIAKLNGLKETSSENIPQNEEEYWHRINEMFLYHDKWENIAEKLRGNSNEADKFQTHEKI